MWGIALLLLMAVGAYLGLALHQIELPGLHHDEAQEAGLMAMQLEQGLPVTLFRDTGITLAGRRFPLMVQDYIGSLYVYLAWVVFGVGGVSVQSLRVMTVLVGVATLGTGFGAARRLFDTRTALLTVGLLAIHPTFIFWTRQGVYVTSYILPLALASLWLLVRWWQGDKVWNLWLAAFLIGVGLWGKLLFLWFVGGLIGGWVLLNLPRIWGWLRQQDTLRPTIKTAWWSVGIAVGCGIIGLAPLIAYNAQSGGTLDNIFNNLDSSYYGVDNSNVGENFRERLRQAPLVYESGHMGELGGIHKNGVARIAFYLAIAGCLLAAWRIREQRGRRLFILLLVALMIAQSSFTSTALWFTHFALVLPFMVLLVAVGLWAWHDLLGEWIKMPVVVGVIVGAGIVLLGGADVLTTLRYHQSLADTGGLTTHSAAIYALEDDLQSLPQGYPVAALDWGIAPAIEMLTKARITPNEVFGYTWEPDAGFAGRLAPFFALDESLYILHAEGLAVFPRRDAFFAAADESGREVVLLRIIPDRTGNPFFEIWGAPVLQGAAGDIQ